MKLRIETNDLIRIETNVVFYDWSRLLIESLKSYKHKINKIL